MQTREALPDLHRVPVIMPTQSQHLPKCIRLAWPTSSCRFKLATENEGGHLGSFARQTEIPGEKDLGRPAAGEQHEADADIQVAFAHEELASGLDCGFRGQEHELALLFVDFGLVGGVNLLGFSPWVSAR